MHPGPILTDRDDEAGLAEIADPAELISEAVLEAMARGEFHVFSDTMAEQIGVAYAGFAENVVEADLSEG